MEAGGQLATFPQVKVVPEELRLIEKSLLKTKCH